MVLAFNSCNMVVIIFRVRWNEASMLLASLSKTILMLSYSATIPYQISLATKYVHVHLHVQCTCIHVFINSLTVHCLHVNELLIRNESESEAGSITDKVEGFLNGEKHSFNQIEC